MELFQGTGSTSLRPLQEADELLCKGSYLLKGAGVGTPAHTGGCRVPMLQNCCVFGHWSAGWMSE